MIFKSIQWRLQLWYGLVLLAVVAGFGFTAFQLERSARLREIDDELRRRFAMVGNSFRPPPGPEGGPPEFDRPGPYRVPPPVARLFDTNTSGGFYYVIRAEDGTEIGRGGPAPAMTDLYKAFAESDSVNRSLAQPPRGFPPSQPPPVRSIPGYHEIVQPLRNGETVLVGCSLAPAAKELRLAALKLTAIGSVVLLGGLAGGWWISSRAMRPIAAISLAAAKISAGDLSRRINSAETESELGQLAAVLNSAFARLEAAFAQQKQFAADAAHELRTPVTVMLTQTQTALQRDRSAGEYRETLEACQRAAQRMRKLIGTLLELARLDAGQEPMKRAQFDLARLAEDCVEAIRPLAEERGIRIQCELPPTEVVGDAERLAQAITNLLSNAIQYNRERGEIRVAVRAQKGAAALSVTDTGVGIAAADLPRVFERFYRVEKSRSSGQNGLGLAISKAIAEAHGGAIEVSSQENTGTTFTLHLPGASP